jgi:hypothetical protein
LNIFKRIGSLCAVIALAAIANTAQAQDGLALAGSKVLGGTAWSYNYSGSVLGYAGVPGGYGGLFVSTLTNNGNLFAVNSYCNDIQEEIGPGKQTVSPTSVYRFSNLNSQEIDTNNTGGTGGDNSVNSGGATTGFASKDGNGALVTAGQLNGAGLSGQQKVDALEYLVATYFYGSTVDHSGNTATSLQYAVWFMWGFNTYNSQGYTQADGLNGLKAVNLGAYNMVEDAVNNGQQYSNPNVLWVYNSPVQNQIMFVTPEGESLALLLPGLIPVGFAIRRKVRKA